MPKRPLQWLKGLALAVGLTLAAPAAQAAPHGEVVFDTYGVPHVYGKDEASVFYGFGYATAANHGNLVLKLYGEARGRAAEYWGDSEVESDKWVLANDVYERAGAWYKAEPAQFRADLDAFAAGMNAYAKAHPDKIDPAIARVLPISGVDVMAHAHRLMNYIYVSPMAAATGANNDAGSNAWAVMPKKSASGNTLLLANPHLPWAPSYFTYFEIGLDGPGFHLYGATQVGLPVLRFAFNDRMGFTNTVNGIAGSTLYELKLAPGGYVYDGKVLPFETATKTYKVRQPDGALKTETLVVRKAVQGPVFDRKDGKTVAVRVAGLDRHGGLREYWDMGRAKSFAELQTILARLDVPTFNIVYADKEGHVEYLDNGILPKHDQGDLKYWKGLVPGDTSKTLWTQTHSYAELPKVIDPPSGYVQNTNDPPWVATYPQVIHWKDFPPYVATNGPMSLRAQQSSHLMADPPKIAYDDFIARKLSTHVLMADRVLDELVAAAAADADPEVQQAVALLKAWNRQDDADSRAALLFETWARKFSGPNFQSDANFKVRWSPDQPIDTPSGLKDPAQAVAMLKDAIAEAKAQYGAIDRPFGEVSRFAMGAVDLPGNGGFGNEGVFRVITWSPLKNGVRTPVHGETWVSLVEFSTPIKAQGLMSYGDSTQPGSPHRTDQLQHLSDKTLRTLWTSRAEVEQHVEARAPF
ncbi:MAG: penicillin acylase family protein [Caulobacterales bacterium]|nr:penicillin acylase family protein [Caulobacterales bacterium]